MRKGVRLTILCEDNAHWRFARQVFCELGFHPREIRQLTSPPGAGAADHYVLGAYPAEVRAHRRRVASQQVALMVIIDADAQDLQHRPLQLDGQLSRAGCSLRSPTEAIAIWVPRRNIETWIIHLCGHSVTELEIISKSDSRLDSKAAAGRYVQVYRSERDRNHLLPSITVSLPETARVVTSRRD